MDYYIEHKFAVENLAYKMVRENIMRGKKID